MQRYRCRRYRFKHKRETPNLWIDMTHLKRIARFEVFLVIRRRAAVMLAFTKFVVHLWSSILPAQNNFLTINIVWLELTLNNVKIVYCTNKVFSDCLFQFYPSSVPQNIYKSAFVSTCMPGFFSSKNLLQNYPDFDFWYHK